MSKKVKVISAVVIAAVGITVGSVGTQLLNSHAAKKGLKREIELANEYSAMMQVLADIYYRQANFTDKTDLSQLIRENGDLARNEANSIEELTRISEDISGKIFVSEKDLKNIVKLEMTIENTDFQYWKNIIEEEQKELEQMRTGAQ